MNLVIDASVACQWYFDEPLTAKAKLVLSAQGLRIAPALILAEVGNVVWKRFRRNEATRTQAQAIISEIALDLVLVPESTVLERAMNLAIDLDHPIYDCFYIATAERWQAPLVTCDRKLISKIRGHTQPLQVIDLAEFR